MNRSLSRPIDAFDFLWMELTPRCNLHCVHCYANSSPQRALVERMQLADWMDTLNQAADLGCRRVQFIGGEPTLYPGLAELIEHARSRSFEGLEVFTNGTVLTDKLKSIFARCNVDLAFSVYAAQEEVHDAVTRQKGSLAKTLASIRWALDVGLTVRTAIVRMGANVDRVAETLRMLQAMGVPSVSDDLLLWSAGQSDYSRTSRRACRDTACSLASETYPHHAIWRTYSRANAADGFLKNSGSSDAERRPDLCSDCPSMSDTPNLVYRCQEEDGWLSKSY
jgi:molybdenum cofactor biosynthesis enzyme MoaA